MFLDLIRLGPRRLGSEVDRGQQSLLCKRVLNCGSQKPSYGDEIQEHVLLQRGQHGGEDDIHTRPGGPQSDVDEAGDGGDGAGGALTSHMEGIIVNTVSSNSSKGRAAIEWIVEKLGNECRALSLSSSLEKLKSEYVDLKHQVAESIINPARQSIEELQGELKTDLERLSKFELAKLGSLELAKLRELQLSLPSPPTLKAEENPRPSL